MNLDKIRLVTVILGLVNAILGLVLVVMHFFFK